MNPSINKNKKYSRILLFLSDIKPILFSHHPLCEQFSNHVYHVGKKKLCIGCFTYYPTILISFILSLIFIVPNINNLILAHILGYIFFIPLLLNILGLTKFRILKITSKISIGIGSGLFIYSVVLLPIPLILKVLMLFQLNMVTGFIAFIRARGIEKECHNCIYDRDWDNCPGLKSIRDKLYKDGFISKKI